MKNKRTEKISLEWIFAIMIVLFVIVLAVLAVRYESQGDYDFGNDFKVSKAYLDKAYELAGKEPILLCSMKHDACLIIYKTNQSKIKTFERR